MFYQMSREKAKLKFGIVFVSEKNIHILVFLTENCSVTVRDLPFFLLNSGIFLEFVSKYSHICTQSFEIF